MTKTELKQNITKITQILQSENYEAGFELLKTINDPGLTADLSEIISSTLREKYFKENALEEGFEIAGILQLSKLDLSSLGLTTLRFKSKPNPLNNLIHLKKLYLSDNKLKSLPPQIGDLKRLKKLKLIGYKGSNVDGLANLSNLTSLDLRDCRSLQNVDGLANVFNLNNLKLRYCESLQNVNGLANCTKLPGLSLKSCELLQNVDGLANLTNLTSLSLENCYSIQNVDGLANLTNLTSLNLQQHLYPLVYLHPKPVKDEMTTRAEVAAYQEQIKKSMK